MSLSRRGDATLRSAAETSAAPPTSAQAERLLMVWLSPGFPVGAFAFSHGLEWAAEEGHVRDRATLSDWLAVLLAHGSARNDLILLAAAHRAIGDAVALAKVAELAIALQPSGERYLETTMQGNAFISAVRAAWACDAVDELAPAWSGDVAYPVAVGVSAAGHGIALDATLEAYGVAFVSALVSAAIRLSVVGQTDGQRIIAELIPAIRLAAASASRSTLDDIGGAAWMSDFASLAHETQYTRVFRS